MNPEPDLSTYTRMYGEINLDFVVVSGHDKIQSSTACTSTATWIFSIRIDVSSNWTIRLKNFKNTSMMTSNNVLTCELENSCLRMYCQK